MLIICVENFGSKNLAGRKEGWMDGWMDGWMEEKAGLRIAYSNQKSGHGRGPTAETQYANFGRINFLHQNYLYLFWILNSIS